MDRRWWIGVVCSVLFLAGCGQSEEDRVREAVGDYHEALDKRDAKRTCELLGPRAHANAEGGCLSYVSGRFDEPVEVDLRDLAAAAKSGSISISGDRATVVLRPDFDVSSVRVDGDWKIESTAPPPPRPAAVAPRESPRHVRAGLARFYPAFARTRTNAETLELPPSALADLQRRGYTPYLDQSRLVAQLGRYEAYAFPAVFRDVPNLCTVISIDGVAGGMSCGTHTDSDTPKPRTSRVTVPGGSVTLAMFPAGVTAAKLQMRDGTVETLDLADGVALIERPGEPKTLTWVDGQGQWSRDVE